MAGWHPILIGYGNSLEADVPLILVIGREPNADQPVVNKLGSYNFYKPGTCAFWNTAYGMAARLGGTSTHRLKARCRDLGSSPIIFADASPQGIPNAVVDKHIIQAALREDLIIEHINNLFSHKQIIARVRLVLLSGLQRESLALAVSHIAAKCAGAGPAIPFAHIPFLHGVNTHKIQQALSDEHKVIIKEAFLPFYPPAGT